MKAASSEATKNEIKFTPSNAQSTARRVKQARATRYQQINALFAAHNLDYPPAQVLMRLFKREAILELWVRPHQANAKFILLKPYKVCADSGELGPKRQRGDYQVPEGFYEIKSFNPVSSFHLSMLVSYPNKSDCIRATARDPGGQICIHGDCVTIGCVPLTNEWIEELYLIALDTHEQHPQTPVVAHLFPARLDEQGLKKLNKDYANKPKLLNFWQELIPGYQIFEETHLLPEIKINKNGVYELSASKQK
ncbi:MAG: hypothetical protein JW841_09025 [Deltaproteobacteria bacterium]|nr:hypothetical protein [Deltaproteobacteria bacterium]